MTNRYAIVGLWFFGIAMGVGAAIVIGAPIFAIRMLGAIGLMSAVAGFLLHLSELRDTDRRTWAKFRARIGLAARASHPVLGRTSHEAL